MNLKNIDKPIALVVDTGLTGYGVIRSLGREGIPVIGIDSNPKQIGLFSKYCKKMICPPIEQSEEKFIDFMIGLGEQLNNKGVLFTTSDVSVLAISRHRSKLKQYYDFPMAGLDVIETLVNKEKFYKKVDELNLPHPQTYFPKDALEVKSISRDISYPCFIKPIYSTYFVKDFGVKGFKANSSEELIKIYKKVTDCGHTVLIQDIIFGDATHQYGFGGYFNHMSQLLGGFTYRRRREWPHGFGTCCLAESYFEQEILELGTTFLKSINYHGIMEVEFKKDPSDNKFKFIEINARPWWQIGLSAKCGINLPLIAYMDTIGKRVDKLWPQKDGIKWLYMVSDVRSALKSISEGELGVGEWLKSLRGKKEYAIFAWDDPVPFFISLSNLSSSALKRWF